MGCCRCNFNLCGPFGVIISLVLGALLAVLAAFNLISNIIIVPFITLGLSALLLLALLTGLFLAAVTGRSPLSRCLCDHTTCLLVGIIGTLTASVAKLAIGLLPLFASVIALFAIGVFFVYMVLSLIAFITCLSKKLCCLS